MVLAVALYREGVPFIALETLHEPFMDQRAASHHPPTVAMLNQLGLAEHMIAAGLKSPLYRFHDRVNHDVVAEFDLGDLADERHQKGVRCIADLMGHRDGGTTLRHHARRAGCRHGFNEN